MTVVKQDATPVLELVQEVRIRELLGDAGKKHYEASGVYLKDGYLHIVFDNEKQLLRIRPDLPHPNEAPVLLDLKGTGTGYEDITFQSSAGRWFCLVEAADTGSGIFMPRVDAFDESFTFLRSYWLDFPLKAGNKGFEGLVTLTAAGDDYLLGLCEGNNCKSGSKGIKPGKGRIQVFRWVENTWVHTGTIRLPEAVRFRDYSSLDLRSGVLTVISQATSAMWVGRFRGDMTGHEEPFADNGRLFLFPRNEKGRILYGNLEGVTWLEHDQLVVVSDRVKADQPQRCAIKDQSIHIFRLPP